MKLSSNAVDDSNIENNSPQKLLVNKTQASRLCKYFANGSLANMKFNYEKKMKTQLHKLGQSLGFLVRFLWLLLKTGLPLIKNVFKVLAKNVLIPLGLTAAA